MTRQLAAGRFAADSARRANGEDGAYARPGRVAAIGGGPWLVLASPRRPRPTGAAVRARAAARNPRRRSALWRYRRARRRLVRHRGRRDSWPHRPERRRQDHAVQLRQPALHPQPRRHPVRGPVDAGAGRRTASPGSASGGPSRTSRCSRRNRCSTMSASAAMPRAAAISSATRCGCPGFASNEAALSEVAWSLLRMLDLEEVALRPAAGLPLGTRKRVELARALAGNPKLLLLDEPAGGLNHGEVGELARSFAGSATSGRSPCCSSSIT